MTYEGDLIKPNQKWIDNNMDERMANIDRMTQVTTGGFHHSSHSCMMEETIKDILKRLEELEKDKLIHEIRNPVFDLDDKLVFHCQDCGKKGRGIGEFSYSNGYCDDCYEKNHSVTSRMELNPLNPQRRIGRKK